MQRTETFDSSSSTSREESEEPLPPGWAMSVAPNGRLFFIDHNTHQTTWVRITSWIIAYVVFSFRYLKRNWFYETTVSNNHIVLKLGVTSYTLVSYIQEDPRKQRPRAMSLASAVPDSIVRPSSNEDLTRDLGPLPVRF